MLVSGERTNVFVKLRISAVIIVALLELVLSVAMASAVTKECTTAVNAALADAVYKVPECCGGSCAGSDACKVIVNGETWVAKNVASHAWNGFDAATFQKEGSSETIIAFRGTEAKKENFDLGDVLTDVGVVLDPGNLLAQWQYYDALSYYEKMQEDFGDAISVTGHSLGGSLAMYVADMTGATAETFNALGLNSDLADNGARGSSENITNFYNADDPVKCINEIKYIEIVGVVEVSRDGGSAYCDALKKAYEEYHAKMDNLFCIGLCYSQAKLDLAYMLKELGGAMAPAHLMGAMHAVAQKACDASKVPDLPHVELPVVPDLPHVEMPTVPDLPDVALPVVPDLPHAELPSVPDLPHFELPTVPDLPHFELPTVPDLPQSELQR